MLPTHRYLAIIAPSPSVSEAVLHLRHKLHAGIGSFSGCLLRPHITLFIADIPETLGGAVEQGMARAAKQATMFRVTYNGITHFPDKRTIYIQPMEKEAIGHLRVSVLSALSTVEGSRGHIRPTDHPHLTIAAGLKPQQFATAWPMLAPHVFADAHAVDSIALLRRELRPAAEYEMVKEFPFGTG